MDLERDQLSGLSSEQAASLLKENGPNTLPETKPPGIALLFIRQFKSPFIYVLLIAALVSFGLGKNINGIFIFAVLLLNATIGSFQEYSAERAAMALNAMVPQMTNVIRDGHLQKIDSKRVVVGDLVSIASGDKVPADGICIQTNQLTVNESLLTGESLEVLKLPVAEAATPEDSNKCFAGTNVVRGRAIVQIESIGLNTEIGQIAKVVSQESQIKPPLLQRIERFTVRVTFATLVVIALIFVISIIQGEELSQVFFFGVALAVSAIPEGLPAAITVALAIGMRRMAKKNVIVRSLLAVESLGSCTYIASDKTGTLTVNDMTIQKILLPDDTEINVSGEGIDIHGQVSCETQTDRYAAHQLSEIGVLANESELYLKNDSWIGEG
ncbi:MAG: HAD-IC family P-type ATPase, partial [Kangiellaceae bacterium]|nr:HAD-IC family P-type ATPase [Kangiellaceae bacterium]